MTLLLAVEDGSNGEDQSLPPITRKKRALRDFIKQYADGAFDPAVISILEDAFEDAWRRVQVSKAPYGTDDYAAAGRRIIAKYIIKQAKAGERDPRWLSDSALLYLSQQRLSRTPPND